MALSVVTPAASDRDRGPLGARLLVATVVILSALWLVGGGWRVHRTWPFRVNLAVAIIVPALVVFGLQAVNVWALTRPKRPTLRVHADASGRAFVAPTVYLPIGAQAASQIALTVALAGSVLRLLEEVKYPDVHVFATVMFTMLGLVMATTLVLVVALFRPTYPIELRPQGLRVASLHGGHDVPWEAVSAGPKPPRSVWAASRIRIGRPDLVRSSGLAKRHPRRVWLPHNLAAVHPVFLVDAVNYYLQHPERRATIGAPGEHERLHWALTEGQRR